MGLLLFPALVLFTGAVAMAVGEMPTFPWADQPIVLLLAFVYILLLGGSLQEEFAGGITRCRFQRLGLLFDVGNSATDVSEFRASEALVLRKLYFELIDTFSEPWPCSLLLIGSTTPI